MTIEEAKKIGEIRNAVPKDEIKEARIELLAKLDALDKKERELGYQTVQKTEVVNQKEIQKIEGKIEAEVKNWPNIFKVMGEVIAKVAFPAIQKVSGDITATIGNFPVIQKIVGKVTANVDNFPEIQRVKIVNPTEKMYVEGRTEITNLPLGKGNIRGDPEQYVSIRLTDGKRFYDLTEMTIAGGGSTGVQYQDPDQRWLREDFTYDGSNNVTKVVAYDGKGFKKTVDYGYDGSGNITRKTTRIETA